MVDAGMVRVDHPQNISAGKGHMPGVKKQGQGGARMGHQKIQFGLGFDRSRHMMVIAQRHALRGAPFGERGHFAPIFFDLRLIQLQFAGKRCRLIALDCTRGFAINNTGCPHGFEQLKLRGNPVFLGFDLAAQQ